MSGGPGLGPSDSKRRWLKLKKRVISILFTLICIGVLSSGAVHAVEPEMFHIFYGDLTINGQPAPAGTEVKAVADGVKYTRDNPVVTTSEGQYKDLLAQGMSAGSIITFYVNGVSTGQTTTFSPMNITEVDLNVNISAPAAGGGSAGGGGGGGTTQTTTEETTTTETTTSEPTTGPAVSEPETEPAASEQTTELAVSEPETEPAALEPTTPAQQEAESPSATATSSMYWYWIGGAILIVVIVAGILFRRHVTRYG
jgi:hypothetical protein